MAVLRKWRGSRVLVSQESHLPGEDLRDLIRLNTSRFFFPYQAEDEL